MGAFIIQLLERCIILSFITELWCPTLTRSIRDSETAIDFVQGPPGSRTERVKTEIVCEIQ